VCDSYVLMCVTHMCLKRVVCGVDMDIDDSITHTFERVLTALYVYMYTYIYIYVYMYTYIYIHI